MGRILVVAAVVLYSCTEPAPSLPDAASPPCPRLELVPATYSLEWSCESGCESDAPYRYFDQLDVRTELRWSRGACQVEGCEQAMDSYALEAGCIVGDGIPIGDGARSDPYSICPAQCELAAVGEIAYEGYPGPLERSAWQVRLTR